MEPQKTVDVLIIGGGPAGAAAAHALVSRGLSVAVMERSLYESTRIGETLSPEALPLLHRIGVWDAFEKDAHICSPGIVSAWGSEQPHENDFIFNPYGNGWHLDRTRFDQTLAAAAERTGAVVIRSSRIQSCVRTSQQVWSLWYECAGAHREFTANFLIDATGRSAWLARQQRAKRMVLDRLVAVIGFAESLEDGDRRTILEATQDGWWYSARLPNGKVVAAFMTDADMLPRGKDNLRRFWNERLSSAPLTNSICSGKDHVGEPRVTCAGTVRLDRVGGPGWIAIGDAAVAYDPLSSAGIVKAMESGRRAAGSVAECLHGNKDALTSYSAWLEAEFAAYTKSYFHHYSQVRRWPEAVFWKRRKVAV
jgi:flavin-dependent dehydrogenase